MLVFAVVAVAPAFFLGSAVGAGSVAMIGALVALFALIALLGGRLRADMRMAIVVLPCLVVASVVPRLVSEVSRVASIAAVVAVLFVAALLPVLGSRYVGVGQGVGMASLFSYGSAVTGPFRPTQLVLACSPASSSPSSSACSSGPGTRGRRPDSASPACWTRAGRTSPAPSRPG